MEITKKKKKRMFYCLKIERHFILNSRFLLQSYDFFKHMWLPMMCNFQCTFDDAEQNNENPVNFVLLLTDQ